MKWLIAFGMFLQFISFWLAAPEIMGDGALKRLNQFLKNMVSNFSLIIITLLIAAYGVTFFINGIVTGMKASEGTLTSNQTNSYFISLTVGTIAYMFFMFRYKKIRLWLDEKIAVPLVNKFTFDERFRRNSLLTGALLFTFGFLIQIIILLIQP